MKIDYHIDIEHLTRVEGHGNIVVNVRNGEIEELKWNVVEAPRFFQSILRGRDWHEAARISSRICGICAIVHKLCAVKAIESAFGTEVGRQTILLRKLLKHAEIYDSNFLHVFYLAAPDYLGLPSIMPMFETDRELFRSIVNLKKFAADWGQTIGGRNVQPLRVVPGGFTMLPTEEELVRLKKRLSDTIKQLKPVKALFLKHLNNIPVFDRPTEYVGLINESEYALYDGMIGCRQPDNRLETYPVEDYLSVTNEFVSPNSTAKYSYHNLESYAVGALARLNLNYGKLHDKAKKTAKEFGLDILCTNPYMNTVAQFIEIHHALYDGIDLIDMLLEEGLKDEKPEIKPKEGKGIAAVEAPRGILFYELQFDSRGICTYANLVIPTNQNHNNIQHDMEKLVPELMKEKVTKEEMECRLKMLVRSYDPCNSCSTHCLSVRLV